MLPLRLSESHWQISGPAAAPRPVAVRVLMLRHRRWVPSHWKVLGNEQADRIAKRANNLNIVTNITKWLTPRDFLRGRFELV